MRRHALGKTKVAALPAELFGLGSDTTIAEIRREVGKLPNLDSTTARNCKLSQRPTLHPWDGAAQFARAAQPVDAFKAAIDKDLKGYG